ncbi:MAG: class I SAM-dependent methyltransferase [Balneolaceae bacterium]
MNFCILCNEETAYPFHREKETLYLRCTNCKLIFVKPGQRLDPAEEKSRYDLHENDPADERYRAFLNQLFAPLSEKIKTVGFGLDFGSGPGPTLCVMFEEKGHQMNIYDPFYANDKSVFDHHYDFITTTETAEHLYHPRNEFEKLWSCLKPGGYFGIMTKMVQDHNQFADWHYMKDDTHVTFYSKETFIWLSEQWNATVEFFGDRTIIFTKPTT